MRLFVYRWSFKIIVVLLLVAVGLAAGLWLRRPALTEEEVRSAVITTIQREAPASFYVTGTLDIAATTTVRNTKYLFPDLLRFNLGTTTATVRMPGRVSYGFDVTALRPEMIALGEEGVVEVTLPELTIYSVEPDLAQMEVETSVGWARLHSSSGQRVEQQALQYVQKALRRQGETYLKTSTQARIHTAEALHTLLLPVLQAAGIQDPHFRFSVGPQLVFEQ